VHSIPDILLADVQAEYAAADGDISQLIMDEQVHVGGLHSTLALAAPELATAWSGSISAATQEPECGHSCASAA
jgi:hypothetical protein